MPEQNPDAEAALRKLGKHIRSSWAKAHPATEQERERVKNTVRQNWEQKQASKRPSKSAVPTRKPKPPTRGL